MLIIFDLDDTLIDTSKLITPHAIQWALKQLKIDLPYDEFEKVNRSAYTSKDSLLKFMDEGQADLVLERVNAFPLETIDVKAVDGAYELLEDLSQKHQLAIVSVGQRDQQLKKLSCAGIDAGIFSFIEISPIRDKSGIYQKFLENGHVAENILVVGDRIATDLSPAKSIGMRTVHFRYGRGVNNTGFKRDVDVTIDSLSKVKQVVYEQQT